MILQNKILSVPLTLLIGISVLVVGCETDDSGLGADGGMGTMTVQMTDAPIDSADAVNVFIERVEVNNAEDEEGWTVLNEPQQSYNLLELVNGATEVIGSSELEPGVYNQIRLILSEGGHSVEVNGEVHDMKVPSGPQTGIKLNINAEIEPDIEYVLLLDFDASRSVVAAGPPGNAVKYLLKPVVTAKEEAITGNIEGTADPAESRPVVYAISGTDTLASTIADTTSGDFRIIGLEEGSYEVALHSRNEAYQSVVEEDVSVSVGATAEIGTIELPPATEE
ncbi:protein of unknown function [Fodinibius roseus]|uniref:DUF4382 domain-containing protein n=1 Tax=Fodinibius roseus TaxID=1194090 RepID=A0A1M4TRW4_9BACT|nr:DUF4382 domain-containing protein [Fodinibius roseus]SHE47156.1 protein of unknown function [Fodinibius roseus]